MRAFFSRISSSSSAVAAAEGGRGSSLAAGRGAGLVSLFAGRYSISVRPIDFRVAICSAFLILKLLNRKGWPSQLSSLMCRPMQT